MILPFMVIYLQSLHFNEEQIGWIVGLGWIMGAFGGPVIGYFSDRWNSKKIYQFLLAIWALTFFGFSLSTNFFVLIFLVIVNGLCRCVIDVILLDRIFLVVFPSDRSRVANYNFIALTSAMALGPLVGSLATPVSQLFVWVAVGLSCLVVLDILWKEPQAIGERKQLPALKNTIRVLYQDRTLFWYIIAGLIFFTIFIQLETTFPIILKEQNFIDFYAILYTIKSTTIVLLSFLLAARIHRIQGSLVMLIASISLCLSFVLFMEESVACYFLGVILFGVGECLFSGIWRVKVVELGGELQATYLGTTNFAYLGLTFGSAVGGEILNLANSNWLYILMSVMALFIFVSYFYGESLHNRQQKQNSTLDHELPHAK